ncbi:MAG: hypothetical protein C0597_06465 [Marinilabiliales bacterium]|nr:MAG: hypothetical protein C0597_06465 [Marinilabiliales bacterium]
MELLLQSGNLDENQYKAVVDAYEASNRISRLNSTLILLAKIENRQFPESQNVNIKSIITNQIDQLEDIIESKKISVRNNVKSEFTVKMNPYLAEILFVNLIKNAIRHNVSKGEIIIEQGNNMIEISNSGPKKEMNSEDLFKRFHKSSKSSESLGLGLAIVKKICEVYNFNISYVYKDMHVFRIEFFR